MPRTGMNRMTGSIPPWVLGLLIGLAAAAISGFLWPVNTIPVTDYLNPDAVTPMVELYIILYHMTGFFIIALIIGALAYMAFRWDTMGRTKTWFAKRRVLPKIGKLVDVERQEEYKTLLTLANEMKNFSTKLDELKEDARLIQNNLDMEHIKNFKYVTNVAKIVENMFASGSNVRKELKGKNHIYALNEILDNMDDQLRVVKGYLQFTTDDLKVINQIWEEEIRDIESFFDKILTHTREKPNKRTDPLREQYTRIKNEIKEIEKRLEEQAKQSLNETPTPEHAQSIQEYLGRLQQEIQRIPELYVELLEIIYKLLSEFVVANTIDSSNLNAKRFEEQRTIFYSLKEKELKYVIILLLMKFVALSTYKEYEYVIQLCRKIVGDGKLQSDNKSIGSDRPNKFDLQQKLDMSTLFSYMHSYLHTIMSTDKSDEFIKRCASHLNEISKTLIGRADTAQHAIHNVYTKIKRMLSEDTGFGGVSIQEYLHRKLPLNYPNSLKDKGDYLSFAKQKFNLLKHLREARVDRDKMISQTNFATSRTVAANLAAMHVLDPLATDESSDEPILFYNLLTRMQQKGMGYLRTPIKNPHVLSEVKRAHHQDEEEETTINVFYYLIYLLRYKFRYHNRIETAIAQLKAIWLRNTTDEVKVDNISHVFNELFKEKYPRMN